MKTYILKTSKVGLYLPERDDDSLWKYFCHRFTNLLNLNKCRYLIVGSKGWRD